jgi:proteasome lid subunit RPN8/RPN11
MSQNSKQMENDDLAQVKQEKKFLNVFNTIPFGPCDIDWQAWKRLKLAVKAYSTQQKAKEVCFVLLGKFQNNRFLIKEIVQLIGETSKRYCTYSLEDVRKIEREASKEKLTFIGMLHTHCGDSQPVPSQADRITWLSAMFEFNRPLVYYIISANSLRVGAYSIPAETFYQLKDAIKFIPFEVKE